MKVCLVVDIRVTANLRSEIFHPRHWSMNRAKTDTIFITTTLNEKCTFKTGMHLISSLKK